MSECKQKVEFNLIGILDDFKYQFKILINTQVRI